MSCEEKREKEGKIQGVKRENLRERERMIKRKNYLSDPDVII